MNWVKTKIIAILNFKIQLSPQNSKYGIAYISDEEEKDENTTYQEGSKADQKDSKADQEDIKADQEKSKAVQEESNADDQEGNNSDQERGNADQEGCNADDQKGNNSDQEGSNSDQERGNSDQERGTNNTTSVVHPKALCPNCKGIGGCLDSQTVIYAFTGYTFKIIKRGGGRHKMYYSL